MQEEFVGQENVKLGSRQQGDIPQVVLNVFQPFKFQVPQCTTLSLDSFSERLIALQQQQRHRLLSRLGPFRHTLKPIAVPYSEHTGTLKCLLLQQVQCIAQPKTRCFEHFSIDLDSSTRIMMMCRDFQIFFYRAENHD